jgi:hypothetical protein
VHTISNVRQIDLHKAASLVTDTSHLEVKDAIPNSKKLLISQRVIQFRQSSFRK